MKAVILEMRLLFIGGTRFSGYFASTSAVERGHSVTLFSRGKAATVIPGAETITGDRETDDIEQLRGLPFDAVIDMTGYRPGSVRKTAELLKGTVGQYIFVSSISAYASPLTAPVDESHPLATLPDPTVTEITGETYGGLKVLCEQAVQAVFGEGVTGGGATIVRPGLIVGPRDPSNRFDYWVERIADGGEVLAPESPDFLAQFIDARDLGEWLVRLAETGTIGTFNAVNPPFPFGALLATCKTVSGSDAEFTFVPEEFLTAQSVSPWSDLPIWTGAADSALSNCDNQRAIAAGLTFRPLATTVSDTLAWINDNRELFEKRRAALSRDREREVLTAYHAANP
jgi:2'-hydroxyisoflavone reductase